MSPDTVVAIAALITAHLLGDFALQTTAQVQRKREWLILAGHAGIIAALSYLLLARWDNWIVPVIVFLSHAAIDAAKVRVQTGRRSRAFALDQLAHLAVIIAVGISLEGLSAPLYFGLSPALYVRMLILVSGLVLAVWTSGVIVGFLVEPYRQQMARAEDAGTAAAGLAGAGRLIGQLERLLIFVLFLSGNPGAIGFLIAAKSIFRFGEANDAKNRQAAEYIIIGTFMSFAAAALVSVATAQLVTQVAAMLEAVAQAA